MAQFRLLLKDPEHDEVSFPLLMDGTEVDEPDLVLKLNAEDLERADQKFRLGEVVHVAMLRWIERYPDSFAGADEGEDD